MIFQNALRNISKNGESINRFRTFEFGKLSEMGTLFDG